MTTKNVFTGAIAALAIALVTATPASAGLVINLDYTSGTASTEFGANFAAMQAAMTYAANQISGLFSDNIHVNISVEGVAGTGILGQSNTSLFSTTFANMRTGLLNDAKSTDDATATGVGGSMDGVTPLADPVAATHTYWLTKAQRKAMGLVADDLTTDGTVSFGAGWTYTFDPNNRAVASAYDFIGVAEHEITEVMGRIGLSGSAVCLNPPTCTSTVPNSYTLLDLFSYTGAGARNMGNTGGSFSIDNGNGLLKAFNNAAADPGTDTRDWAAGTNDSFNARSNTGVLNNFSAVDIREMDAIGYDLAAPEPSTMMLMFSGLLLAGGLRKKFARR